MCQPTGEDDTANHLFVAAGAQSETLGHKVVDTVGCHLVLPFGGVLTMSRRFVLPSEYAWFSQARPPARHILSALARQAQGATEAQIRRGPRAAAHRVSPQGTGSLQLCCLSGSRSGDSISFGVGRWPPHASFGLGAD